MECNLSDDFQRVANGLIPSTGSGLLQRQGNFYDLIIIKEGLKHKGDLHEPESVTKDSEQLGERCPYHRPPQQQASRKDVGYINYSENCSPEREGSSRGQNNEKCTWVRCSSTHQTECLIRWRWQQNKAIKSELELLTWISMGSTWLAYQLALWVVSFLGNAYSASKLSFCFQV